MFGFDDTALAFILGLALGIIIYHYYLRKILKTPEEIKKSET